MNWKRIGQVTMCFLLICCLLINISPIRAEAVFTEIYLTACSVAYGIAIASLLIGMGVLPGVDNWYFNQVIEDCKDYLRENGFLNVNDEVDMYLCVGDDIGQYMISQEIAEAVRAYLWDEGVIFYDTNDLPAGFVSLNGYIVPELSFWDPVNYPFAYLFNTSNTTKQFYAFPCKPDTISSDRIKWNSGRSYQYNVYYSDVDDGSWYYDGGSDSSAGTNFYSSYDYIVWTNFDVEYSGRLVLEAMPIESASVGTSFDLTLGDIASSDKSFSDGYSTWASGAMSLPTLRDGVQTDAESAYIALGMGATLEETLALTQSEVQAGTGTYEDTGTASDTVTASGLKGWLDTLRMSLVSGFSDVKDSILSIPSAIVSGITSALETIFVPSEDFLTAKVDALRAEFAFADTIITGGQMIGDAFGGFDAGPPIIYIDLGATRGDYDIGGEVPFIDLTWYEEYKPTVDMLLSSFLWVVFIWKLFQKAPGIISGMPGDFVMEGLQTIGADTYLPYRKESHEKVRRLNRRTKL